MTVANTLGLPNGPPNLRAGADLAASASHHACAQNVKL